MAGRRERKAGRDGGSATRRCASARGSRLRRIACRAIGAIATRQ